MICLMIRRTTFLIYIIRHGCASRLQVNYPIQQVKAGIGLATEHGNVAFPAVFYLIFFPPLLCPFDGISARFGHIAAEIIQCFRHLQIDKNGVKLTQCKIRKSLFKNTFINHTPEQFQAGTCFIIEYSHIVFAAALSGIYFPAMIGILQRIAHIKPHIVAHT